MVTKRKDVFNNYILVIKLTKEKVCGDLYSFYSK